ncbi:hypothetical protein [Pendulispora albinea]|uniref:VWA domain-containing protein n=1 Tax=Pendulispora albinea TaxID=2741071 RepID=A0ABZ2LLH2_9BACT
MSEPDELMRRLGARIERLALGPEHIEAQHFVKMTRVLFVAFGYRPKMTTTALEALAASYGSASAKAQARKEAASDETIAAKKRLHAAREELEDNVAVVERATIVARRPLVAYAAWLRRVFEHLAPGAAEHGPDEVALLPPLVFSTDAPRGEAPEDTRSLELELALVDHLLEGARLETRLLGRRRQQLLAARQVLLEVAAALPIHPRAVAARSAYVARQIAWLDRLQAAGLEPDVDLVHQARRASRSGDARLLYASLRALEEGGDAALGPAASRALEGMPGTPLDAGTSLRRSFEESFGTDAQAAIARGHAEGRAKEEAAPRNLEQDPEFREARIGYFEDGDLEMAACALAVDGAFELGAPMTPVRIVEEQRRLREVRYPTRAMHLVAARGPEDLRDALITDPRALLLDLATGRLLTRRFIREETEQRARIVMTSEARVYVLDGSSSMNGWRSRMRDAILLAELATLRKRLEQPGTVRPVLYFRYFTRKLGPITKVDTAEQVGQAIVSICSVLRDGETDIERALLASFATVAKAKESDPTLARAQIVLVTDGCSEVNEAKVIAARESVRELPIGVSVIALGEENPALRALVARQRALGERAFYHFVDDAQLEATCKGESVGPSLHLGPPPQGPPTVSLEHEIGPLLDELELIARKRDRAALEDLDVEAEARRDVGLDAKDVAEGERARAEALYKDRLALERRYARWFPSPAPDAASAAPAAPGIPAAPADDETEEAVFVALSAIAEVIDVVSGSELHRRADAIALLERLLPDARLTPAAYMAVVSSGSPRIAEALRALHASVTE